MQAEVTTAAQSPPWPRPKVPRWSYVDLQSSAAGTWSSRGMCAAAGALVTAEALITVEALVTMEALGHWNHNGHSGHGHNDSPLGHQ